MLPKIFNTSNSNSLNQRFRKRRFKLFLEVINSMSKPVKVLDIGGTHDYWKKMNFNCNDINITLLNLNRQEVDSALFSSVIGDATDLREYGDKTFDLVFSNS